MSAQDRGPAYVISLIAGVLILLGGVVRAVSAGLLPAKAYGAGFRVMSTTLRAADLNFPGGYLQLTAVLGIMAGIIILVGAVMLASQSRFNAAWGTVIVAFSVVGSVSGGGFFIGSVLGILGGIIAITWKAVPASR